MEFCKISSSCPPPPGVGVFNTVDPFGFRNGAKWGNIIQFTPGGRKASPFGRHILTAFYHGVEQQLMVTSDVNGNKDFHTVKKLQPNQWHKVEVSQEKISDDHYYNVIVNGETIRTAINTAAKTHINATIFTSAPWYEALEGNIQKLTFYYKPRCVDTGNNCADNARRGYCQRYKSHMMTQCKKTCGFCGASDGGDSRSSSRGGKPVAGKSTTGGNNKKGPGDPANK